MKVNLIFPELRNPVDLLGTYGSFLSKAFSRFSGWGKTNHTPPLSLLMLAAVTPDDIELNLIDERIEQVAFDDPVDLVGVTVVTRSAPRAYEIAAEYRKRGVKVVLGGIHPSALPKEAIQHADSLVLGEGESVWPEVLKDYKQGCLKSFYRGIPQMDLDILPFPRREILRHPEMYWSTKALVATRGCPNTCTFCSAGIGLIKKYRKRSVEKIISELEMVPGKIVVFADDNLGWDPDYTKELFRAMIPLRIWWTGALSANALEDEELIDLAARSGCFLLGIGFESISPKVIESIRKTRTNQPSRYAENIKRVQDHGVGVWGNFVIGFDDDDKDTFHALRDFIEETHMEIPSVWTLIPYPGSVLYKKFDNEGRLLHKDWKYYDDATGTVVYTPKQMTSKELMDGYYNLQKSIYSKNSIFRRLFGTTSTPSLTTVFSFLLNMEFHQNIKDVKTQMHKYEELLNL